METTRLYRLVRALAAPSHFARRGMLFLTATPMQLDTHELYSLVELLDPTLFPSEEHFEQHCGEAPGLSRLVEVLATSKSGTHWEPRDQGLDGGLVSSLRALL